MPALERSGSTTKSLARDQSTWLSHYLVQWLTDADRYDERVERLRRIKTKVAHGGASRTAARYILSQLGPRRPNVPRPHFLPAAGQDSAMRPFAMADGTAAR